MRRFSVFLLLIAYCALLPGCGEWKDPAKLLAFGDYGSVEITGFDPNQKPPALTYSIYNYTHVLTYLKVKFVITVEGQDYEAIHEPLGTPDAPGRPIQRGMSRSFTVTSADLPTAVGKGEFTWQARGRVIEFKHKAIKEDDNS